MTQEKQAMVVQQLNSAEEFNKFLLDWKLAIVHFYASWAPACEQVNKVLKDLQDDYKSYPVGFAFIDAEGVPDVSAKHSIAAAPTLLYFKGGKEVDRVNGYIPSEIESKLTQHSFDIASSGAKTTNDTTKTTKKEDLETRLKNLIGMHRLMLFMKGTPDAPRCGFSKQMVGLLNDLNADFGTFDILSDEEVRQGLKDYSNWPTFPQLYLDNELIGGLDVFREEMKDNDFVAKLPKKQADDLNSRLKSLIDSHKLMLFMKGDRDQPQCKFSRAMVELLNGVEADYGTFDILKDEEVRQGLKTYSNWPTYPQLYLNGELLGGLDVVKAEMADENFVSSLPKKS